MGEKRELPSFTTSHDTWADSYLPPNLAQSYLANQLQLECLHKVGV